MYQGLYVRLKAHNEHTGALFELRNQLTNDVAFMTKLHRQTKLYSMNKLRNSLLLLYFSSFTSPTSTLLLLHLLHLSTIFVSTTTTSVSHV